MPQNPAIQAQQCAPHLASGMAGVSADGSVGLVRVLLVDDSIVTRSIVENMLDAASGFCVAASVASAAAALAILADQSVDIILLDLEMPGMHGLDALPLLRDIAPDTRIIIFSAHCALGGEWTDHILALGADDVVAKPAHGGFDTPFMTGLLARLKSGGAGRGPASPQPQQAISGAMSSVPASVQAVGAAVPLNPPQCAEQSPFHPAFTAPSQKIAAIAIGASTGGVQAIAHLLEHLPQDLGVPVFIAQHLPHGFLPYFAAQLRRCSGHLVAVAAVGMAVEPGGVYLLPGDQQLGVSPHGRPDAPGTACGGAGAGGLAFTGQGAAVAGEFCPSVDRLLGGMAQVYGASVCAIILSGMGKDGLAGAHHVRRAGGLILAQDCASSTVWGMPGALVNAGLADAVLAPAAIGKAVGEIVGKSVGNPVGKKSPTQRIRL